MLRAVAAIVLLILTGVALPGDAAAKPRVVSLNLCADQLLLALADADQVLGLSPFAADPTISYAAGEAARFPRTGGSAEEAIALGPDLVLMGPYDRAATRAMLAAQHVAVADVDIWRGFEAGEREIMTLAMRLGHPERGAALVRAIEAARHRAAGAAAGLSALALGRGGYADGPASLTGALIEAVGARHVLADQPYGRFVPMERLLLLQPDVIVGADEGALANDRKAAFLRHPALVAAFADRRHVTLAPRLTGCAGPSLIEALDRLADALRHRSSKLP